MVGTKQIDGMKRIIVMVFCVFLLLRVSGQAYEQLDRLQSVYVDRRVAIEATFIEERLALPQRHMAALRRLEAKFQREALAQLLWTIQQAVRQFVFDPTPSGLLDVNDPQQLVEAQQQYVAAYVGVARVRRDKIMELQRQYRAALHRLKGAYTEQGDTYGMRKAAAALDAIQPVSQLASVFDLPEIEIDLGF